MSFQWKFSCFLQMKFSSMEKIAIFANESNPYTIWLSPFRCDTILVINIQLLMITLCVCYVTLYVCYIYEVLQWLGLKLH